MCQVKHSFALCPACAAAARQGLSGAAARCFAACLPVFAGRARGRENVLSKRAVIMRFWQNYRIILNHLGSSVSVPRHAGSVAAVGFMGAILCLGLFAGGHSREALKLTGSVVGLGVNKVQISGNKRVSEIDVLQALGLDGDTSLPILNIDEAQAALARLPWVEHVAVRKIYPDRLAVRLTERRALAVWQKGGAVDIIDARGQVIAPYNRREGRGLPFFVGEGAELEAAALLASMRRFPELASRVRAYIRVAGRRWDILLDNGLRIRLPERRPFVRLQQAVALDRREGLFNRAVESVDLRLEDRITVALGEEAYARRLQAVAAAEKREKALKNGGQA